MSHVRAGQSDVAAVSRGLQAGRAHQREASAGWDGPADGHAVGNGSTDGYPAWEQANGR